MMLATALQIWHLISVIIASIATPIFYVGAGVLGALSYRQYKRQNELAEKANEIAQKEDNFEERTKLIEEKLEFDEFN